MHTHADHLSSGLTFQFVENVNHIPPLSLSPSLLADACSFAYRPLVVRIGPASGQICRRGVAIDSAIVIPTGASADARLKSAESRVRAIFPNPRGDRYSSGSGEPTMKTRKRPAARRYGATRPARENIREKEKEGGREREGDREGGIGPVLDAVPPTRRASLLGCVWTRSYRRCESSKNPLACASFFFPAAFRSPTAAGPTLQPPPFLYTGV